MIKVFDRIKEISTTDGTGNFKLEGALFGFRPFSSVYASGDYCYYTIVLDNNYEIGSGEYIFDGSNHWLSRFSIHSTNSNNLVNFSNGVKEVFVTYPAKYAVYSEKTMNSGNLAFWGAPNSLDSTNSLSWNGSSLQLNGVNVSVSGHTHTSNDILDFNQTVSGLLPITNIVGGPNISVTTSGATYTIGVSGQLGLTAEQVDDRVASLLVAGTGIVLNYNDNSDILTINTSGLQPSGNYSVIGHTHSSSDIIDFNSAVSNLLPKVANSGDNRVLTSTGSTTGINAESNLTFDGTALAVTGNITVDNLTLDNNTIVSSSGNLVVAPAAGGALVASTTGNARGIFAVDLQTFRNSSAHVASADYSVVCGGFNNAASGLYSVVAGGRTNRNGGEEATVSGGTYNVASGKRATIGGGNSNTSSAYNSTVGGGAGNIANSQNSTVGGGANNTASAGNGVVCGGYKNTASGGASSAFGGTWNTASAQHATVCGGYKNIANSNYSFVGGGRYNTASGYPQSTVSGGGSNTASNTNSTVAGGRSNTASGASSFVGGGYGNTASSFYSVISGGRNNSSSGWYSTVAGGRNNSASSTSNVSGGAANSASAIYSAVGGGINNLSSSARSVVSGGTNNVAAQKVRQANNITTNTTTITVLGATAADFDNATANAVQIRYFYNNSWNLILRTVSSATQSGGNVTLVLTSEVGASGQTWSEVTVVNTSETDAGIGSTVCGGVSNIATGNYSTVGGGQRNTSSGAHSTTGGGSGNISSGTRATVSGGFSNSASNSYSVVGGGQYNGASGDRSVIGGGQSNVSVGNYSTVSGGFNNAAGGIYSNINGGTSNISSNTCSTVGGGFLNTASAIYSTVGGGSDNKASASYSTIPGGVGAKTNKFGELSHAAGFFENYGDAQHTILVARRTTTDATANVELKTDGSLARLTVPAKTTWSFSIKLSAYNDTDNTGAWWKICGGIRRNASNETVLIGSLIVERDSEGTMSGTSASIVADDTNEALEIRVTGLASKNIRWVAVVDISQVSYGTP